MHYNAVDKKNRKDVTDRERDNFPKYANFVFF
jgi:hypothetical protein